MGGVSEQVTVWNDAGGSDGEGDGQPGVGVSDSSVSCLVLRIRGFKIPFHGSRGSVGSLSEES